MNRKTAIVLVSGLLCACAQPQPAPPPAPPPPAPTPAPAPVAAAEPAADRYVTILAATCQTYLGLPDDDRAAASMFYIGYQARRFGSRAINVSAIPSIEGLAVDYCGINPSRTVASAFAEAYREARRW
jgi:HdeA/HdeB family